MCWRWHARRPASLGAEHPQGRAGEVGWKPGREQVEIVSTPDLMGEGGAASSAGMKKEAGAGVIALSAPCLPERSDETASAIRRGDWPRDWLFARGNPAGGHPGRRRLRRHRGARGPGLPPSLGGIGGTPPKRRADKLGPSRRRDTLASPSAGRYVNDPSTSMTGVMVEAPPLGGNMEAGNAFAPTFIEDFNGASPRHRVTRRKRHARKRRRDRSGLRPERRDRSSTPSPRAKT
jgi:hypothetical protein